MAGNVTVFELSALQSGKSLIVQLSGRGAGSLVFKGGKKACTAFFRERTNSGDSLIKIGKVSKATAKNKNETISSLKEIMNEANRLHELAATVPSIKQYLADEKVKEQLAAERQRNELEEIKKQQKIESARGSLSDLFLKYIENSTMQPEGKDEHRRVLKKELNENNPAIASKKARDVTAQDIVCILRGIEERGSSAMADKVRAYLGAAFQYEIKGKNSYRPKVGNVTQTFELTHNPVNDVPKEYSSRAVMRALTNEELKQFYNTISKTKGVSESMGLLFMLNIQLGGQRILQLSRASWTAYDLKRKIITIIDPKGRKRKGQEHAGRTHIIPLTESAIAIIQRLKAITEGFEFPFSVNGDKPFQVSSFSHATRAWLTSTNAMLDGEQIIRFSARDIRRTCTQLMKKMGIHQEHSDALQSHGLTGVVMEHYLNDPYLLVPDKLEALKIYERELSKILKLKVKVRAKK
ncbi:tyrosine-type recombinase/integrase [Pseudomonas baetica]|uniref:tyrosine-type recombinase/integrase n=1 Tax=Pseudomonas baetica TaxID=674054 RepID=UPI0024060068|nr:integrase [Pseudomonas baetica]MDF9776260.1 integrase [Pseudomonas baetica]